MARKSRDQPAVTPTAQLEAIIARTAGFDPTTIRAQIERDMSAFTAGCIEGNRCFDDEIGGCLPGLAMAAEHMALATAFTAPDAQRLADALSQYVAFQYLHYRALRCRFWHQDRQSLYGIFLDTFGFAACAGIFLGARRETQWLSGEYARHIDAGYEDEYSVDAEFLGMCRWLAGWASGGDPLHVSSGAQPLGLYEPLRTAIDRPQVIAAAIDEVLAVRAGHSYRQLVRDDEDDPKYYRQLFSSLFPFEVLAYMRLAETRTGQEFQLTHPLAVRLQSVRFSERHSLADFVARAERRIERLEQEIGLGISGS